MRSTKYIISNYRMVIKMVKKLKIVFASHTFIGGPFVVGSHHLAREMTRLGHEVLHISTPITPFHYFFSKNEINSLRKKVSRDSKKNRNDFPINYIPFSLVPWKVTRKLYCKFGVNLAITSLSFPSMKKYLDEISFSEPDILLIDQPTFIGIEKFISPKITIYRATDLYTEMTGDQTISIAERDIIGFSDGVIGTSGPVLDYLQKINNRLPNLLIENGVDFEHYTKIEPLPLEFASIPTPRAIYVGAIDDRLDLGAFELLAKEFKNLNIVIIGPDDGSCKRIASLYSNIYLLGSKPYTQLPQYLNHSQIALLPLSDHEANKGRSPMKLYEYAASGLPVIVKETPEIMRRNEEFIHTYKDQNSFIELMNKLLADIANNSVRKNDIRDSVHKQSWRFKAQQLLEFSLELMKKV